MMRPLGWREEKSRFVATLVMAGLIMGQFPKCRPSVRYPVRFHKVGFLTTCQSRRQTDAAGVLRGREQTGPHRNVGRSYFCTADAVTGMAYSDIGTRFMRTA
jgi:hypothetical protein